MFVRRPYFNFLNSKPPPNYVAGVGRGALGFTTRSDIGPGIYSKAAPGVNKYEENDEDDLRENFDDFKGCDMGLFSSAGSDDDDREADAVWEIVDKYMASRRKDRKDENPTTIEQISHLFKPDLAAMTPEQWDSIPEVGNYSRRNYKRKRFKSFVPVPDTLLQRARQERALLASLDPKSLAAGGTETPATDLTAVGEGRGNLLSLTLDQFSVRNFTSIDTRAYLAGLNSTKILSDVEISDIKKARLLMKSLTQSRPEYPRGWISAARLEEVAGDINAARRLIQRGCHKCPKNEDVWLEACRLARPDEAKAVIAKGVKANPKSVKLWLQAAELEHEQQNQIRVLMKALERVPTSVRLWKAIVELANEEDGRILLQRAVEVCPLHVELWLALARLETHEQTKKVLNKAREKLPKEPSIWITAAKLEEAANGDTVSVGKVIDRGIRSLQGEGVGIDREVWMKEAEVAERAGSIVTCQTIIKNTIGVGVEEEDRKRTWVTDAEECKKRGSIETARAIYAHALTVFPTKKSIWLKAAELEKSHGTRESLEALLRKAVTNQPQTELLWLLLAKEKWLAGDVPAARAILQDAYAAIPNSEEIWLAAFKLEFESHEPERARMLLSEARERGGTGRVWMKSAIVERELGNTSEERRLLEEGLKLFPSFFKLWLMLGQMEDRLSHAADAKEAYESGLKHCPKCPPLWLSLANIVERMKGLSEARAVLTMARKKNPQNPQLWLASISAESRHGNREEADRLMAKALQQCPSSGILWAASIEMVQRPQRKRRSADALNRTNKDAHVIAAVAKLFWYDRKVDTARNWFNKAVTLAPDIGDFWAWYYKFELRHGTEDNRKDVLKRCIAAEPKHGRKWQTISKAIENSHLPVEALLKKAAAFGLNSVVYVPKIKLETIAELSVFCEKGCLVASTLSNRIVLLQQAAILASFHYNNVEIVESRPDPSELPSQEAVQIANNLSDLGQFYNREDIETENPARGQVLGDDGVRVHSMVLPGLPSSTTVHFSRPGEVYSLKHDITDIQCLMPGLILAIRKVVRLKNLIYGLEKFL